MINVLNWQQARLVNWVVEHRLWYRQTKRRVIDHFKDAFDDYFWEVISILPHKNVDCVTVTTHEHNVWRRNERKIMNRGGRITLQIKRKFGDHIRDKNQKRTTTTFCTNMENISGKYSWRSKTSNFTLWKHWMQKQVVIMAITSYVCHKNLWTSGTVDN